MLLPCASMHRFSDGPLLSFLGMESLGLAVTLDLLTWGMFGLFSKKLQQFPFPLALYEGSDSLTSLPRTCYIV